LWAVGRFDRETVDNRQFHISGDGIGSHYDQHVIRRRYAGRHVRTIHQGAFPLGAARPTPFTGASTRRFAQVT